MSITVNSTVMPRVLEPDVIKNGKIRLLVHWDINEKEVVGEEGNEPKIEWEYQEQVIWVPLPNPDFIEPGEYRPIVSEAGIKYLTKHESEILNWAKAGFSEAPMVPGVKTRTEELEDAIIELTIILAGD